MSSIAEDAEKVWAAVSKHDIAKLKDTLADKTDEQAKDIVEYEVNTIVLTKHSNQRDGLTCLHFAAKKGHSDILKLLFRYAGRAGLNSEVRSSVLGWCPIHYAVYSGQIHAVKTLIKEGADIDAKDNTGYTPLHVSIDKGFRKMLAILVHERCNVNIQDASGNTPLHLCFLLNHGWSPQEQAEVVDYLLSRGAESNTANNDGDCALHTAVKRQAPKESIEILCKKMNEHEGIATPNSHGKIPLHLSKSIDISEMLIEYGGSLNRQDNDGLTLLHLRSDDANIVEILLEKGADSSVKDNTGKLPIHHGVMHKVPDLEAIKLLGESLSDVNTQDEAGDSPLHLVCDNTYSQVWLEVEKSGKIKRVMKSVDSKTDPIVSWLISKGADSNLQNAKGETALHRALKHKSTNKADILARAGADPMLQDETGAAAKKLNSRWFNKMDRQGTFLSLSRSSMAESPTPPRESWFQKLSREASSVFRPRIQLEEADKQQQQQQQENTSDWLVDPSHQDQSLLLPPATRPGTASSSSSTVIAAPPPSIRFNAAGRTKTQLNMIRMKREQTLWKPNTPVKALPNTTYTTDTTDSSTTTEAGAATVDAKCVDKSDGLDSTSESLSRQLSNLHLEVSDVKDLLEELSGEGESQQGSKPEDCVQDTQPQMLERQLTSLQDEVTEVKEMLEQLDSDGTSAS